MIRWVLRYWHTLRYLKVEQIAFQLLRQVYRPSPRSGSVLAQRAQSSDWVAPITKSSSFTPPGHFTFLGKSGNLSEIGWDGPERALLWRYNQHYFADLLASSASERTEAHAALITDWIAANPAGQGTGWHAYPTSLRMAAWIKWALAGNRLPAGACASLADQARWLSRNLERHILGNHLFVNAKALLFAGLWFEGPEAQTWRDLGLKILAREFPEQILADGGHFELSPMYHCLAVEDVLDLVNIAQSFAAGLGTQGMAALSMWQELVPQMMRWMAVMRHPDGDIAFFNDAAIGIAPAPEVVANYATRLGFPSLPEIESRFTHLQASGYARAALGPAVLLADMAKVGPDYLPGHAHADTLSFELSLDGYRCVVNGGTSVYGTSAERVRQRGTAAHATALVDGQDSSEVWSGFRVARRASVKDVHSEIHIDEIKFGATHTGYLRLTRSVLHSRTWSLSKTGLLISDHFSGRGQHNITIGLPIAPDWALSLEGRQVTGRHGKTSQNVTITAPAETEVALRDTTWHPEFGIALPAQKVEIRSQADLPLTLETEITWQTS
ncbi:MAG: alginate lyase family protein [Planktotalea sp.]|uniref:heparinase II/III family protein n=1 Tax=Planktotalea sp. TaxID=2029877 RepID=UPI003C77497F